LCHLSRCEITPPMVHIFNRPCRVSICTNTTRNRKGLCDTCLFKQRAHQGKTRTRQDQTRYGHNRPNSNERGYGSRWQAARIHYLNAHPFCVFHLEQGKYVPALVVDHIKPHKGDPGLFWDQDNWQALCKRCHDSDKQRIERGEQRRDQIPGGKLESGPGVNQAP